MYKIQISNLKDGEIEYEFLVNQKDIRDLGADGIEISKEIKIFTSLYKVGNQFDLKNRLSGRIHLNCDRCLEKYEYEINTEFEIIYKLETSSEKSDEVSNNDEIKYIAPKTGFIDIKEDIRDYILLSIPLRKVPAEENDICLYCHKNISNMLNSCETDKANPVWEKLLKAKIKK